MFLFFSISVITFTEFTMRLEVAFRMENVAGCVDSISPVDAIEKSLTENPVRKY